MRRLLKWYWGRKWRRWATYIGVPLFFIGNIAVVEMTSHSSFCNSCHIMGPYYDSWHSSSHRHVQCVKCHISPGMDSFVHAKLNGLGQVVDDLLHRTSTKPSASVDQLACTRSGCHDIDRVKSTTVENGSYKFDHSKHIGAEYLGLKLACSTCHAHIKGDQHFEINTAACITCHLTTMDRREHAGAVEGLRPRSDGLRMESRPIYMLAREPSPGAPPETHPGGEPLPPNTCTTCHDPPREPFAYNGLTVDHSEYIAYGASCESCHRGVTSKPEPIDDAKCLACHTFGVEKSLPVKEMHRVHAEGHHKVECFSCHGVTRHGPPAQILSLEQFDCRNCHREQHSIQRQTYLFSGTGNANGADDGKHPKIDGSALSPMFMAHVDCTGCHIEQKHLKVKPNSGATVARPSPKACDACHAPGLGDRMIPLWQRTTREMHDEIASELAAAPEPPDARGAALMKEARDLLELVRVDGSWGVHNPKYTQQLLERAREKLRAAREARAEREAIPQAKETGG